MAYLAHLTRYRLSSRSVLSISALHLSSQCLSSPVQVSMYTVSAIFRLKQSWKLILPVALLEMLMMKGDSLPSPSCFLCGLSMLLFTPECVEAYSAHYATIIDQEATSSADDSVQRMSSEFKSVILAFSTRWLWGECRVS